MKRTTPLLLLCMLSLLIARAAKTTGDKGRIQELKKERKQIQKEVQSLKKLQVLQNKKFQAIQKQWTLQCPAFHADPNLTIIPNAVKTTETSIQKFKINFKVKDSLNKDSNFLKQEIVSLKQELHSIQKQIHASDQLLQSEKQKIFQEKFNRQLLSRKATRQFKQAEKKLYYLQESWNNKRNEAIGKLKIPSFQNQLNIAKLEQLKMLNQMKSPGGSLPKGYQSKSRLQNKLPANQQGIEPEQHEAMNSRMQEHIQNFNVFMDSLQELKYKDSLHFKPNPYKSISLYRRLQPAFAWQAQKNNGIYPGRIEWMPGLKFLWTPKLRAHIALILRTGVGTDIQHMELSFQGYGLQSGIQYNLLKKAAVTMYYDRSYFPETHAESIHDYVLKPGFILGMSTRGKLQLMLGYDFLQYRHPEKGSPWIMRFSL